MYANQKTATQRKVQWKLQMNCIEILIALSPEANTKALKEEEEKKKRKVNLRYQSSSLSQDLKAILICYAIIQPDSIQLSVRVFDRLVVGLLRNVLFNGK